MTPLVFALALISQYPTPQAPQYGAPPPAQYGAPPAYSLPVTYAAPQIMMLGAGQVVPPNPFGLMLGRLGQKLERCAWPRVQPMMAAPAVTQTVYLQMAAPIVQQAVYTVAQPAYQAAPPYGVPQTPAKSPPTQYGTPQTAQGGMYGASAPTPSASKPDESAPPVPKR